MKKKLIKRETLERCRAVVTFTNGMGFTRTTQWADSSHGFDGGHWGTYPHLRAALDKEVRDMQMHYGAPGASMMFYRETRIREVIQQDFDSETFYAKCQVEPQP